MSTLSPLQPQNGLDGASTPKSRMRVTVLTILALHVVFIGGLLMQGCDKKQGAGANPTGTTANSLPSLGDTNYFSNFPGDPPGTSAVEGSTPGNTTGGALQGGGGSAIPPVDSGRSGQPVGGVYTGIGGATETPDPGLGLGTPVDGSRGNVGTLPVAMSPTAPETGSQGMTEHVIKSGDTIGGLAKVYGVPVQAVLDANPNSRPRSLKIGDRLLIPPPTPATQASTAAPGTVEGDVYVVKAGDNLTRIARKFGVTVKALRATNQMRSDRLVPKQRLIIPQKAPAN
ncbi:MAG: LysM peptidoglycan-binding domain-containing protein [Limisphaerales bacterium]